MKVLEISGRLCVSTWRVAMFKGLPLTKPVMVAEGDSLGKVPIDILTRHDVVS